VPHRNFDRELRALLPIGGKQAALPRQQASTIAIPCIHHRVESAGFEQPVEVRHIGIAEEVGGLERLLRAVNFTGSATGISNPFTVTIAGPMTLTANFSPLGL
jgi:hypothetical protein